MSPAAALALATFLWLADFDPAPWPRCRAVAASDLGRFPPEAVCRAEMNWWWLRQERIKFLADEALAGPWRREWLRDYEEAAWMHAAWDALDWAHHYQPGGGQEESVIEHLRKYRDLVGDGNYIAGWSPPRVAGR